MLSNIKWVMAGSDGKTNNQTSAANAQALVDLLTAKTAQDVSFDRKVK